MARDPLFRRLPEIWCRLDAYQDGVLERFLGVWDTELDSIRDKTEGILDLRSVDRIADRYLPLLAILLGHRWDKDESYAWNREQIREAVIRYSYKGTLARVDDLLSSHEALETEIQDNASRIIVLGKQGRPGYPDCHFIAPDFNHDGAFKLTALDVQDQDKFLVRFEDGRAVGEVWWWNFMESPTPICAMDADVEEDDILRLDCTTVRINTRDWRMDSGISIE